MSIKSSEVATWLESKWLPTPIAKGVEKQKLMQEVQFACQIIRANETLQGCDAIATAEACINVTLSGLTLNPVLQYAYLVPFKGKAAVMPSYKGLCSLAFVSGAIRQILANVVYELDCFEIDLANTEKPVIHKPYLKPAKGEIVGVYALATLADGTKQAEWMDVYELNTIRELSQGFQRKKDNSIWGQHYGEMARKTVVKRLVKYLPKVATELLKAIELDNEVNEYDLPATMSDLMNLDELLRRCANAMQEKEYRLAQRDIECATKQSEIKAIFERLRKFEQSENNLDKEFKRLPL